MKRVVAGLGLICISTMSQADVYGLVNSRTADIRSEPQMTAEAGMSLESELNTIGGQLNFKLSPESLIYGTIAKVDPDLGSSEISIGGGVFYQFDQSVVAGFDVAVKGSYHLVSSYSNSAFGTIKTDLSDFGLELVISPQGQSTAQGGARVFGSIGLHRLGAEASAMGVRSPDNSTELSLGFGAVSALATGEIFAAVEFVDEIFVGFGYRMALGQK